MASYQYYDDFKLIDKETGIEKRLSDFGGIVYNPDNNAFSRNMLPDPEHITDKNENQDGERFVKTVYGTRIIEVPVYFSEDLGAGELFELNRWLGKKKQQTFQWVNDDEREVFFNVLNENNIEYTHFDELDDCLRNVYNNADKNDIILLIGAQGMDPAESLLKDII